MKKLAYFLVVIMVFGILGANPVYAQSEISQSVSEHTRTNVPEKRRYLDLGNLSAGYELIAGEFVEFTVDLPERAQYEIIIKAGSLGQETLVSVDGIALTSIMINTGSFDSYQEIDAGLVELAAGTHTVHVSLSENIVNSLHLLALKMKKDESALSERMIYLVGESVASDVPEAQRYGDGRESNGWGLSTYTYVEFNVPVDSAAKFTIKLDVGSVNDDAIIYVDGKEIADVMIQTGSFVSIELVTCGEVDLNVGTHIIRISTNSINGNGLHLRKLILEKNGEYEEKIIIKQEFENYNSGGQNVGYYDITDGIDYDWCIDRGDDVEVGVGGSGMIVSMSGAEWMKYDIDIPQSGKYTITCSYSFGVEIPPTVSAVFSCNNQTLRHAYDFTGSWNIYKSKTAGSMYLEEGRQTIQFLLENYGISVDYFTLELTGTELVLDKISANGNDFISGAEISCSTDVFELMFSDEIDATRVTDENISLYEDNEQIPLVLTAEGKMVKAASTKALAEGKNYEIRISDIVDKDGLLRLEETTIVFITGKGAVNGEKITELLSEMKYEELTASGRVLSSAGIGMEGRKVKLFLSGDVETSVAECISDKDGTFIIHYTLPAGSPLGKHTFLLQTDYANEAVLFTTVYVSLSLENDILDAFSQTKSEEDARRVFENYETDLGMDMTSELADVENKNKIYQAFTGKRFDSIAQIREAYYVRVAVELLMQATESNDVDMLLNSDSFCDALELNVVKLSHIVGQRASFIQELLAIPDNLTDSEVKQRMAELVEQYVLFEYGKEDLILSLPDISLYSGQVGKVKVTLPKGVSDVSSITLLIECDSENFLKNTRFVPAESVKAEVEYTNNLLTLRLTPGTQSEIKMLGTLEVFSRTAEQFYLQTEGSIQYGLDLPFELKSEFAPCKTVISVSENRNKGGGGGSLSGSGLGGVASVPSDDVPDAPEEKEEYEFKDLETAVWAKEAVRYLLAKQVLSEADDGRFRPQDSVTREEFVKMIVMALGLYDTNATVEFTDTGEGRWYNVYIASAMKEGLVTGYEDGSFGVGKKINREDMTVIICRALKKTGYNSAVEYVALFDDDDNISSYAKEAVYLMKELRLIEGMSANRFEPKFTATRAMAAKMVYEMMKAVGL